MLYLVGLGLGDARDITVKGLEVVRAAHTVFLESYTSILAVDKAALESFYGREVIVADRESVEQRAENILANADRHDVVFLVVGDPLGATTHTDIILRAVEKNIPYQVIHNASIINAIGCCGLQLYSFGETVSIPFWTDSWRPESFADKVERNLNNGLHTLCLLDIKVKELSIEHLMRGKEVYEKPRYMSVAQAAHQLLEVIASRNASQTSFKYLVASVHCVGVARVGTPLQTIASDSLSSIAQWNMGGPLHSLVIVGGELHPLEEKMLQLVVNAEKLRIAVDHTSDSNE